MRFRHSAMTILVALAVVGGAAAGCIPGPDLPVNQTDDNDEEGNDDDNQQNDDDNNEEDNDDTGFDAPDSTDQVVLSELMASPTEVSADDGQWIELANVTDEEIFDLQGCTIVSATTEIELEIEESLGIVPGHQVTIASGDEPGFEPDRVIEGLELPRVAGDLTLMCDGEPITGIDYHPGQYPVGEGVSLVRDPDFFDVDVYDEPWLWCEGTGAYNGADVGSPGQPAQACPWYDTDTADDIAAIRDDVHAQNDQVQYDDTTLEGVMVTYVRETIGGDEGGFFVQAAEDGPALFVLLDDVDDAPVRPGQVIDLEVDAADLDENTGVFVTEFGDIDVVRLYIPTSEMAVDVTDADDLVESLDDYEHRLVSAQLTIEDEPGFAGPGFSSYPISTAGMGDSYGDQLVLRVPYYHVDNLGVEPGCELTVRPTPMWRYDDTAQVSFWKLYEATDLDCAQPPAPIGAEPLNATSVRVDFSRALGEVESDGSQFSIDGLSIDAATYQFNEVILETDEQVPGDGYTVEIDDGLVDFWGHDVAGSADFVGFESLEVAITEFMANFRSGGFDPGEYLELTNLTNSDFDLTGCELIRDPDGSPTVYEIDEDVDTIAAGDQILLASSDDAAVGLQVDGELPFVLRNAGDSVEFACNGETIDFINWSSSHVEPGISQQKDVDFLGTPNSADGSIAGSDRWCFTPQDDVYEYAEYDGEPKYGTPGEGNTSCQ